MNELKQNSNRLNQAAKAALEKAGESPEPHLLYSLQLAHWLLEAKPEVVPSPADQFLHELRQSLQNLLEPGEEDQVQALLLNLEGGEGDPELDSESLASQVRGKTPEQMGAILLENLYDNLQRVTPAMQLPEGM